MKRALHLELLGIQLLLMRCNREASKLHIVLDVDVYGWSDCTSTHSLTLVFHRVHVGRLFCLLAYGLKLDFLITEIYGCISHKWNWMTVYNGCWQVTALGCIHIYRPPQGEAYVDNAYKIGIFVHTLCLFVAWEAPVLGVSRNFCGGKSS